MMSQCQRDMLQTLIICTDGSVLIYKNILVPIQSTVDLVKHTAANNTDTVKQLGSTDSILFRYSGPDVVQNQYQFCSNSKSGGKPISYCIS